VLNAAAPKRAANIHLVCTKVLNAPRMASGMSAVCMVLLIYIASAPAAFGRVTVTDDRSDWLKLAQPAKRIISLAPNITELLFAAGAGRRIVGTVDYSDYPAAARTIPRIGNYGELNLEALLELRPDLIVAWGSGSPATRLQRLRQLGIPVYVSEPRRLRDIATNIEKLGRLTGKKVTALRAAAAFRRRLHALHKRYADRPEISIFYEVWHEPLTTINGRHLISQVMRLCGGRNVFADLPTLAPQINLEAVLARNPDVIIAGGAGRTRPAWLDAWRQYSALKAVKAGQLYVIAPALIERNTSRVLDGAQIMCRQLERARLK
jgi:iron complex transport system substrate-binding protein